MAEFNKVEGMLLYTCVQNPVPCKEEKKGKEFKVSVVVSRDFAEEFEEAFTKISLRKVRTAEFEEMYRVAPPEEFADEKFQYILTLRKNSSLANGKPVPPIYCPKVLMKKNGTLKDVTADILVGNGSYGVVSLEIFTVEKGEFPGTWPRLKNVLVKELVEYVRPEGSGNNPNVDPVFGEFESDASPTEGEFEEKEEPKAKAKPAAPAKPAAKAKAKPAPADDEDESPF